MPGAYLKTRAIVGTKQSPFNPSLLSPICRATMGTRAAHGNALLQTHGSWENTLPLMAQMKFYDKYPQLKEKNFLAQVLTNTVFSTMLLENQQVSMPKVREIVLLLLKEQELKSGHFFSN